MTGPRMTAEPGAWRISVRLFGWAIDGDLTEPSAHVAEGYGWSVPRVQWDHDEAWRRHQIYTGPDGIARHPRPWSVLPWLTEHALRGHMDWPGL